RHSESSRKLPPKFPEMCRRAPCPNRLPAWRPSSQTSALRRLPSWAQCLQAGVAVATAPVPETARSELRVLGEDDAALADRSDSAAGVFSDTSLPAGLRYQLPSPQWGLEPESLFRSSSSAKRFH